MTVTFTRPKRAATSSPKNREPRFVVVTGGLPDEPLGELPDDEARNKAIAEAAKPRRIQIRD
jgi:hypothetical protein